jgi:superkiller protein 3
MRQLYRFLLTLSLTFTPTVVGAQSLDQLWQQGLNASNAGNHAQAELIWRQISQTRPEDPAVYNNLGLALMNQQKLDEAIAIFTQAIQRDRNFVAAYNNLGLALAEQGKLNESGAVYMQGIQRNPNLAAPYTNVGDVLRKLDRIEEAISAYQLALNLPDMMGIPASSHTLAHYGLGLLYQKQGQSPQAIAEFMAALKINPNYQPAQASLRQLQPSGNSQ